MWEPASHLLPGGQAEIQKGFQIRLEGTLLSFKLLTGNHVLLRKCFNLNTKRMNETDHFQGPSYSYILSEPGSSINRPLSLPFFCLSLCLKCLIVWGVLPAAIRHFILLLFIRDDPSSKDSEPRPVYLYFTKDKESRVNLLCVHSCTQPMHIFNVNICLVSERRRCVRERKRERQRCEGK